MYNSKIKEKPHVTWVDNFSKIYAVKTPNIRSGSYVKCLWTGYAHRSCHLPPGDFNMNIPVVNNELLNIMPSLKELKDEHVVIMDAMKAVDRAGMLYYNESICLKYNANGVPLKINVTERQEPVLYNVMKRNSVYAMTPEKMSDINIGTNKGLLKILRELLDESEGMRPKQYRILNTDINIYQRIMKVYQRISYSSHHCTYTHMLIQTMYDQSGGGG